MNLIVAVDRNWAIGRNGQLLVAIPQDQKRFRDMTLGKVVVMGRKTLESLPGGQPLPKRTNLVLSSSPDLQVKGVTVCHSIEEARKMLEGFSTGDIYIIGGEQIYRQFLPYCDRAFVTAIDFAYQADTYFPNLEQEGQWTLVEESEEQTYFNLCYTYRLFARRHYHSEPVRGKKHLVGKNRCI